MTQTTLSFPASHNRTASTGRRASTRAGSMLALLIASTLISGCVLSNNPNTRTPGQAFDDEVIERVVRQTIRESDEGFKGTRLNVVSYNGVVLLAGQVPSEALKTQAEQAARTVGKARRVHNELEVRGPTSHVARTNDAWLTSKVKSRLLATRGVPGSRVKVETENGVVYLMGLVTPVEADSAAAAAQKVFGVQKIVKVFEYVEAPPETFPDTRDETLDDPNLTQTAGEAPQPYLEPGR